MDFAKFLRALVLTEHLRWLLLKCFILTVREVLTEAATGGALYKKVFLKVSQDSQENTSARASFLIKLQTLAVRNTSGGCFCLTEVKVILVP